MKFVREEQPAAGDHFRAGKRLWSAADDAELRKLYPHQSTASLAPLLRRTINATSGRAAILGIHKSAAHLASPEACRLRRGQGPDHPGFATQFKGGHAPQNKGLRRPGWFRGRMRETQYIRGTRNGKAAQHWMPIGATRLIEGYIYRKVSDVPNVAHTVNWKAESLLVWTRAHGAIPPGHKLAFRNGDRADCRLENLELVTHTEMMRRNSIHTVLPKPLADAVRQLAQLKRQIRKRTHEKQDR